MSLQRMVDEFANGHHFRLKDITLPARGSIEPTFAESLRLTESGYLQIKEMFWLVPATQLTRSWAFAFPSAKIFTARPMFTTTGTVSRASHKLN